MKSFNIFSLLLAGLCFDSVLAANCRPSPPLSSSSITSSSVSASSSTPSSSVSASSSSTSASPSACAGSTLTGNIQVYNSGGSLLGYLSNTYDGQNSITYGTLADALEVQLSWTGNDCTQTGLAITMVNGPSGQTYPYLGFVGGSGGYYFATGNIGYAYMSGTGHVSPNSPPSSTAGQAIQSLGYDAPCEASVWTFDILSGSLSVVWTNTDSTQDDAQAFYDPSDNSISVTGDLNTYNTEYQDGDFATTLVFVAV